MAQVAVGADVGAGLGIAREDRGLSGVAAAQDELLRERALKD